MTDVRWAVSKPRVFTKLVKVVARRTWEALVGSLNYAAEILPLGRLKLRRLLLEGNPWFMRFPRDKVINFPPRLRPLLRPWLRQGVLDVHVPWTPPRPSLSVVTDASDWGWGFQSSEGHQDQERWSEARSNLHINARELLVPLLFLQRVPVQAIGIRFLIDNQVAVACINKQGSRSRILLEIAESLFRLAEARQISLTAQYLPGTENQWADALSRLSTSSVEWTLTQQTFRPLCQNWGTPQIDLFASPENHRLPLFLARNLRTAAGGPDALSEDWNRWTFVYLFPPPSTSLMAQVTHHLRSFRGRVMLIAPLWEAQLWCQELLQWCPNPLQLPQDSILAPGMTSLDAFFNFHAWIFCPGPGDLHTPTE